MCTVVGIVGYLAYMESVKRNTVVVDFYVGHSPCEETADVRRIQDRLDESKPFFGRSLRLNACGTRGYEENCDLIQQDEDGLAIAYAYYGINSLHHPKGPSNARLLVPLTPSQVHIIARKDFVDRHGGERDFTKLANSVAAELKRFRNERKEKGSEPPGRETGNNRWEKFLAGVGWFPWLRFDDRAAPEPPTPRPDMDRPRYPRFFLGNKQTATRDIARSILDRCNLDPDLLEVTTVRDRCDMKGRLLRGELDVAFCTGPSPLSDVKEIALSGDCCLIGLGDSKSVIQEQPFLETGMFERHAYVADSVFCPKETSALVTRKVVICSEHMTVKDAYRIGKAIEEALGANMEEIGSPKPHGGEVTSVLSPHQAAIMLKEKKGEPVAYPDWLMAVLPILGLLLFSELVRWIHGTYVRRDEGADAAGGLAVTAATPVSPPPAPQTYQALSEQLEFLVEGWSDKRFGRREGAKKLEVLRNETLVAVHHEVIDENQAAKILAGCGELQGRIERSRRAEPGSTRKPKPSHGKRKGEGVARHGV
jgi:TRAP-type uncharacterized transport system substrate-binding protein